MPFLNVSENLGITEDRANKAEKELKNFQESVAIQLSSGSRMVDSTPLGIRERIKDLMLELKEKQYVSETDFKTNLVFDTCILKKNFNLNGSGK